MLAHDKASMKRGRNKRVRQVLCVALLTVAAWPLFAWCAARALIVRTELDHADAIVVLAGSDAYLERTQRAAQLYLQGRAPKVILTNDNLLSGWSSEQQRNPFFAERAADELRRAGVPAENIEVLPGAVHSTYDEAVLLHEYAVVHRLNSILVVTSAYHSRRALWMLGRVFKGINTEVGVDAPPTGQQSPAPGSWWWRPRGWRIVALEYPKFFYYWLKYR